MDGFFEKFSIYDFFNLLASGIVFLLGLLALRFLELTSLADFLSSNTEMQWVLFAVILGGCYLIGTIFQQTSSIVFERKYSNGITSTVLCNRYSVLTNQIKLEVHQKYARSLFLAKGIPFDGDCFSGWHCEYYFAYCSYYIQNRNKHHKAEKMRGLRGIYSLLVTCFAFLCIIALFRVAFAVVNSESYLYFMGIACVYLALLLLYVHAYKENTKYWVRMVLGVYEACVDIDMREINKES